MREETSLRVGQTTSTSEGSVSNAAAEGTNAQGGAQPRSRTVCRALVNPKGGQPVAYLAACRVDTHAGFNQDELSFFETVARSLAGLIVVPK